MKFQIKNQNRKMNMYNNMQSQMFNDMNMNAIYMQYQMLNNAFNNNMQNHMFNDMNNNILQNQTSNIMNQFYNQNMAMNMNHQVANNKEKDDDLYKNEPEDVYPYIKAPKKEIIFVKSDFKRKRVLIPENLRKNELYYTSTKFRCHKYSKIKLLHNAVILDDDDSSIECISNGDFIKINEYLDLDTSYYESLCLKYKNSKFIKITLIKRNENKIIKSFPADITVLDMMKVFLTIMEIIPFKYPDGKFIYQAQGLDGKKNELLKNVFEGEAIVYYITTSNLGVGSPFGNLNIGKVLNFYIRPYCPNFKFNVGTLAQIKEFYKALELSQAMYSFEQKFDKVIINPGNIEIKKDDERTFSDIGIRKDFECELISFK